MDQNRLAFFCGHHGQVALLKERIVNSVLSKSTLLVIWAWKDK